MWHNMGLNLHFLPVKHLSVRDVQQDVFGGERNAIADALNLNAGVALHAADVASSPAEGVARAQEAQRSGKRRSTSAQSGVHAMCQHVRWARSANRAADVAMGVDEHISLHALCTHMGTLGVYAGASALCHQSKFSL